MAFGYIMPSITVFSNTRAIYYFYLTLRGGTPKKQTIAYLFPYYFPLLLASSDDARKGETLII